MGTLATILGGIAGIVDLVCFILVVVKMFQNGRTGMGIACIVLVLCCVGGLVAFIYGWINAKAWNITNIMTIWTISIIVNLIATAMNPAAFQIQLPH